MSVNKDLPESLKAMSKTDAEYASELKQRLNAAFTPLLAVMGEAAAANFLIQWSGIGPTPPDGRHRVMGLQIVKVKVFG